ncbi:hypothetical protein K466DRAFT_290631 [Polyporus arcularius HHB13444]|uniref:BTB domain-containing protein n=1 Tax=Polyporus arcularius HHB13444 TaxID=1314778 RepID=A0A5C3Q2G4_9APHY|nr:hypothetical protein K466DRAFT_290631 [Polyporus arcularius HHB13444]
MNVASREEVSQHALLTSIERGTFEDVKFYTFSRRTQSGLADKPRALFGNSVLIRKTSSYFDYVLTDGSFTEGCITDMSAPFPGERSAHIDLTEYGYASDSDLEDESEGDETAPLTMTPPLEDAEEPAKVQRNHETATSSSKACGREGRVVFVEDIAYRTWKAFVFYAYSGKTSFAPLKSQEQLEAPTSGQAGRFEPPPCSPKSMYRLAEKYGIESLKEEALEDLKGKLSPYNILTELFSSFTMLHPDVQKMEIKYLRSNIKQQTVLERLPKYFQSLEDGDLHPGAGSILATLFVKIVTG